MYTAHFALQGTHRTGSNLLTQFVALHGGNRRCQVFALGYAVTDYHHFLQHLVVRLHGYVDGRLACHGYTLRGVTHVRENQNSIIRSRQGVVAFKIRHCSRTRSFNQNRHTDERFARIVLDDSAYAYLRIRTASRQQGEENCA